MAYVRANPSRLAVFHLFVIVFLPASSLRRIRADRLVPAAADGRNQNGSSEPNPICPLLLTLSLLPPVDVVIYTRPSSTSSWVDSDPSSPSFRSGSPCPEYLLKPDNRTPYGCFYTRETRPYYRNSLQDYHFTMDIDNPLGSIVQQMPTVDVFALSQ